MRVKAVLPLLAVTGLLLTAGCSAGVGLSTRPPAPTPTGVPSAGIAVADGRAAPRKPDSARAAAFRKWGLPLLPPAPAPPAVKPVRTGGAAPVPVVERIPTRQKVVFLTIDDGAEKDPGFAEMMQDLKVPFTMFLTDRFIRDDYGYFAPLKALGTIENHTVTHPDLRSRNLAQQRAEICGQQVRLKRTYGTAPGLFRPPYGAWNETTRAAVRACGLRAIVNWNDTVQRTTNVKFGDGADRFQPGDIILAHFHGAQEMGGQTMTQMTANLLREIATQGYTLANLEDYV